MDKVLNWVKAAFAAISGVIGWFFGLADGFLYALIAFVVLDYVQASCAPSRTRAVQRRGLQGIFHKFLIFALVGLGISWTRRCLELRTPARHAAVFSST